MMKQRWSAFVKLGVYIHLILYSMIIVLVTYIFSPPEYVVIILLVGASLLWTQVQWETIIRPKWKKKNPPDDQI